MSDTMSLIFSVASDAGGVCDTEGTSVQTSSPAPARLARAGKRGKRPEGAIG